MADCNSTPFKGFSTDAIHEGQDPDQWNCRAVVPMICTASTFKQRAPAEHYGYDYSRSGNPTRTCFERCLAKLENCEHGISFSSGLSCLMSIVHLFKAGDHILSIDDVYGGTNRYLNKLAANFGLEISMVDFNDEDKFKSSLKKNTVMVWAETPTNPTLRLIDIAKTVQIAKAFNKNILVVVDNTFLSPYFQRPVDFGADVVMHSVTKYINGHSDVVMGVAATNLDTVAEKLRFIQMAVGAVPSAFDSYLANRGMKTLAIRMKQHYANSKAVFHYLNGHSCVDGVVYPAHPSHPQYELWKRQCRGYSGMITFYIKGDIENARKFLSALKVFTLAESLGGFESLAEHPALMTHASVPEEQRKQLKISPTLIRLSVGLEDVEDLIADLERAFGASC